MPQMHHFPTINCQSFRTTELFSESRVEEKEKTKSIRVRKRGSETVHVEHWPEINRRNEKFFQDKKIQSIAIPKLSYLIYYKIFVLLVLFNSITMISLFFFF